MLSAQVLHMAESSSELFSPSESISILWKEMTSYNYHQMLQGLHLSSCRKFCNIPDYIDVMAVYKYIAILCNFEGSPSVQTNWILQEVIEVWVTWLVLPISILSMLSNFN